jgi:hypothetical protein
MTTARLMFLALAIASFAPVAMSVPAGRWAVYYYGATLACWVLVSVVAVRLVVPEGQAAANPCSHALAGKRLIIVARNQGLFGHIRSHILRVQSKDSGVRIITDRRVTERRRRLELYIPERRRTERRHYIIKARLRTRGWAEVGSRESGDGDVAR